MILHPLSLRIVRKNNIFKNTDRALCKYNFALAIDLTYANTPYQTLIVNCNRLESGCNCITDKIIKTIHINNR